MTLSKKNRDKLQSISIDNLSEQNNKLDINSKDIDLNDPKDLFYSIIDNTNDIKDTVLINENLKKSEEEFFNSNNHSYKYSDNKNSSLKLSEEDLLYDEFNYLLDEQ